jgi:aspartyl-tRNA(Asn)/glutamyl-tRNA(Gln) amidotransferase subunit A
VARLYAASAKELGTIYRGSIASPSDVVQAIRCRMERLDPQLNAFRVKLFDEATAAAEESTRAFARKNPRSMLEGIPVSVKDNFDMAGHVTHAGSEVCIGLMAATKSAAVIEDLMKAGVLIVGKTNMTEFGSRCGYGSSGRVENPRSPGRTAGGSSSGAACAAAVGLSAISLGSDTSGSVRYPAALCGVVGLKPTHSLISTRGVLSISERLDDVGILARSVDDVAIVLQTLAAVGHRGSSCLSPASLSEGTSAGRIQIGDLRIGIPDDVQSYGDVSDVVERGLHMARKVLRAAGAR